MRCENCCNVVVMLEVIKFIYPLDKENPKSWTPLSVSRNTHCKLVLNSDCLNHLSALVPTFIC